ncbi:unnamed protein product [Spodoptera littoralis]|uniref:Uncharacterized protein n=1 Tax=Spodoptera littoralis TaxID=7109 RepID=A0A9P0I4K9_SPOLI|nr:unnamed protein product [Spodoptera littoralis]CAH1639329.1 unnamed protein product [Spodoptera littoralis]
MRQGEVGVWGSSAAWPRPTSAPHPHGGVLRAVMTRAVCPLPSHLRYVVETVVCKPEPPESPPKKVRSEDYTTYALLLDPYALHYRALSAFRPWDKREPVLQHPERVVRVADCTSFERDYQPNVA